MAAIIAAALVVRMALFPIHALSITMFIAVNNDVHLSTDRRTTRLLRRRRRASCAVGHIPLQAAPGRDYPNVERLHAPLSHQPSAANPKTLAGYLDELHPHQPV